MPPAPTGVAALTALALLCACSSASTTRSSTHSSTASGVRTVPPPAATAHLSTLPPSSVPDSTPASPSATDPAATRAVAALLAPGDLSPGFTVTPYADAPLPQPCLPASATPVLEQFPPVTHVGRQLTLASPQAILTEQIDVFGSAADAAQVEQALIGGLGCTTGHLGSGRSRQPVDVQGPVDLRTLLNVPVVSLLSWTLQTGQLYESFVVARSARVVTTLMSLFPLATDPAKLPDGRAVAQVALRKVLAAKLG